MKSEINNENKAKFFAQYWGQDIYYHVGYEHLASFCINANSFDYYKGKDLGHILLTPLSQITDKDAIEVAKILDFSADGIRLTVQREYVNIAIYSPYNDYPNKINTLYFYHEEFDIFYLDENGRVKQYDLYRLLEVVDYLRSKGYALPFLGLSINDMINAGWIKLKD